MHWMHYGSELPGTGSCRSGLAHSPRVMVDWQVYVLQASVAAEKIFNLRLPARAGTGSACVCSTIDVGAIDTVLHAGC